GATRIRHEDRLVETEEGNRYQVSNKEIRIEERQSQRQAENGNEDVEHPFLRIDGANLYHFLAILDRSSLGTEIHVFFDVNYGAIRAGHHRLAGCSREPVDYRAAHQKPQHDFGLDQRQLARNIPKLLVEQKDDRKKHGSCAYHGGANQHRLG